MANKKIRWDKPALHQFNTAITYIAGDSEKNAIKVKDDIIKSLNKAVNHPEFYAPDKYKKNNDGSYRSFELHHYRISYRIKSGGVIVLRVRHTAMKLKKY